MSEAALNISGNLGGVVGGGYVRVPGCTLRFVALGLWALGAPFQAAYWAVEKAILGWYWGPILRGTTVGVRHRTL